MAEAARRFAIRRCLGSGGFGEVYLATMSSPGGVETEVAVKLLHEGIDPRSQAVQRLRDEGRLLGALNHPSVLKVHDLVLLSGRIALVMEYVPGLDLEQCFELPEPIGLRAGLECVYHVADALHVAYDSAGADGRPLRLIHRDIKPPNVRVGLHGEVKVLDFGIAKAEDERREAKTLPAVQMGSPWYMAPERFAGVNDGPAADIYALGCTLYEVATRGQRLMGELSTHQQFRLSVDPDAHRQHVRSHLAPLAISPELRWLLDRMLAWSPEDRPTAAEVRDRADELAEQTPGEPLRRWCKRLDWPDLPTPVGSLSAQELTEERVTALGVAPPAAAAPAASRRTAADTLALSLAPGEPPPAAPLATPPAATSPAPAPPPPGPLGRAAATDEPRPAASPPVPDLLPSPAPPPPAARVRRRRSELRPRDQGRSIPTLNRLIVPGTLLVVLGLPAVGTTLFLLLLLLAAAGA